MQEQIILEEQSNRYYLTKQTLPLRQKSLASAAVLYAYFCLMDLIRFPSEMHAITIPLRLVFFLIPLTILAIVYWKKDENNQDVHLAWLAYLYVAAGFIYCYLLYLTAQYKISFPDSGFILIILYGCLLNALPVKVGVATTFLIIVGFIVAMVMANYTSVDIIFNTFVYGFFGVLCLAVNKVCQDILIENFSLVKRLYNESIYDGMTHLYNRRHFDQQLKLLLQIGERDSREVGLIFLDVDHFKQFNDTKGHHAADVALTLIATQLNDICRRDSDFAARYGGDEFVLVFYDINEQALKNKCADIIDSVRALKIKHPKNSASKYVSVSVGATLMLPSEHNSGEKSLKKADQNLYIAKNEGRNGYCYA